MSHEFPVIPSPWAVQSASPSFHEYLVSQYLAQPPTSVTNAVDVRRLGSERAQLSSLRVPVRAFHFPDKPSDRWDAYGADCSYGGFQIRAIYDEAHPYRPPRVTLDPAPQNRHYYNDGRGIHLCYTKPEEWNPRFTMTTTLAVVFRFISDLRQGRAS